LTEKILPPGSAKQRPTTISKFQTSATKQQLSQQPATMEVKQSRQQLQPKQDDVQFLQKARTPSGGLQKANQLQPTLC